jgi:putative ABC transport system permease protein
MRQQGRPAEASTVLYQVGIDDDYLDVFGHELVAGRALRAVAPADSQRVLLNETAVRALGFAGPEAALNQRIVGGPDTLTVAGVVADFHQEGLFKPIDPIGFRVRPPDQAYRFFTLDVSTTDLSETVGVVNATFERFFPGNPFNHAFMDDLYDQQYRSYARFGRVFGVFAGLAILVACLGLFGLASFAATQRTKEIGIRKALGATVPGIVGLLSKDFLMLVLVGSGIALPLVWIGMEQWLGSFAYRMALTPWVFLAAVVLTLVIAQLTVIVQALRAARVDPAKSLRYE